MNWPRPFNFFRSEGGEGRTGWSNVGWQFGPRSHHAFIGRLGLRYAW